MGNLLPSDENNSLAVCSSKSLLDQEEFRRQGHMIEDFLADYYRDIEKYPVRIQVKPGYLSKCIPKSAPYNSEPIESILQDVQNDIIPGLSHWQSPNHFAYFPCTVSIAGFLGEILSTGFNVVGFSCASSPAATELEMIVMNWLGQMLKLPKSFLFSSDRYGGSSRGGVLLGTTCEAILCTITAARDQMLNKIGRGNIGKLVVYGSDQIHCGFQKASRIAGIHPKNFRCISTSKATNFELSPHSLQSTNLTDIESGLTPLYLCATVGTTSSTAVDPLRPLCKVTKKYGIWVHVDAAYAGSACTCPEFRHFIDAVENRDSFSLNAHKWLFTNLECCCLWVKNSSALVKALSTNPKYLKNKATESEQVIYYKDWQITLCRRFRSPKLWLVIQSYGVANLRNCIRSHVKMAKQFEELISMDERFEIVVPSNDSLAYETFSMVCFRLIVFDQKSLEKSVRQNHIADPIINELNQRLLESINASGIYIIRFAVGATLTEERHVNLAWKVVQEHTEILAGSLDNSSSRSLEGSYE
ncbi:hypothetical protein MKX01_018515 [Papaver californicum]|nr:hypothetical protein MKX01_018515 [Papaver californicum]